MFSLPGSLGRPRSLIGALCAVALGTTLIATAPSPASAEAGAPDRPGGVALTWVPQYMSDNHYYSRAEATSLARQHDLVAGMPFAFAGHSDAMRSANPDLSLLAYANATLASESAVRDLPEAAFAHDTAGRRIKAPEFGTFLMESSTWRWRMEANAQCDDRSELGGFDGCLVDMLTLGVFSRGFVTSLPVNPATGREYTEPEYRSQMESLAKHYRTQSPGLIHAGNSVENAYRYWQNKTATSQSLVNSQPAAQMEDFLRGSGTAVDRFPSPEDWKRNVDVIRDMESKSTAGLFTTKLWVSPNASQVRQWQAYAMASFLMGANGNSYLAFTASRDKIGVMGSDLPFTMPKDIGAPSGAMTQSSSGVWTRGFSNGLSIVNPTSTGRSVSLGRSMRNLDGVTMTNVWLPPNSGQVLLNTSPADDTNPPSVTLDAPTTNGGTVRWSGRLTDDVRAAEVRFAVRDMDSEKWLQGDGSWGPYRQLAAQVANPSGRSSDWSASRTLPPGRYGISVIGFDAAGNESESRPWAVSEGDTAAPEVSVSDIRVDGRTVTWSGRLDDDVRAAEVRIAVRDQGTSRWLQADGSWGPYRQLDAEVSNPWRTSSSWTASRTLPPGSYGVSVIGVDGVGNISDSRPWRVVNVAS